ncbi:hypothetical protein EDC04DRAFT_3074376 [Pisolithus marmoratus]|nr:hypothetical protein EDC04DRAFT_3074376 [Pisolithus marmoratus]
MPPLNPLDSRALIAEPTPLSHVNFVLNSAAVAGLFGGEEALASMATVHIFGGKAWGTLLGWYNSPGSYTMGISFMRLARSATPAYDHGAVQAHLAALLEYDAWKGPKFTAVHSGTTMHETGHIAALLNKECADLRTATGVAGGRVTKSVTVTIVKLGQPPRASVEVLSPILYASYFAIIPVTVSMTACVLSAVYSDWYALAIILFGITANGSASMVIGSGKFFFTHPESAPGSLPGDGILDLDDGVVLLKGEEEAVSVVTRGRFFLLFRSEGASLKLGICSILLIMQSLVMLIFISQSSFFGQLMFVGSLTLSWAYNLWVWTFDKGKIQRKILNEILGQPVFTKFILKTRTSMLVFVALALQLRDATKIIKVAVFPSTEVWDKWKEMVIERLVGGQELEFKQEDWNCDGFSDEQKCLLEVFLKDAMAAYALFKTHEKDILT